MAMLAYHDDPDLKAKYIGRMEAHIAADELQHGRIEGLYGDGSFSGCAVTCCMDRYGHAAFETEIGYPIILARLYDTIYEHLVRPEDAAFALAFLVVVRPGADLALVWPRLANWMLTDPEYGILRHAETEKVKTIIANVAAMYAEWCETGLKPAYNWRVSAAAVIDIDTDIDDPAASAYVTADYAAAFAAAYTSSASSASSAYARKNYWSRLAKTFLELLAVA